MSRCGMEPHRGFFTAMPTCRRGVIRRRGRTAEVWSPEIRPCLLQRGHAAPRASAQPGPAKSRQRPRAAPGRRRRRQREQAGLSLSSPGNAIEPENQPQTPVSGGSAGDRPHRSRFKRRFCPRRYFETLRFSPASTLAPALAARLRQRRPPELPPGEHDPGRIQPFVKNSDL